MAKIVSKSYYVWGAAQLKPNMLKKALKNLERQKIEFFAPSRKITIRRGSLFKTVTKLLFPGYIFVKLDPNSNDVRSIDSTLGINKLVRVGREKIGILPHDFIEIIKKTSNADFSDRNAKACKGSKIRWTTGPLANFIGIIEDHDESGRLKVLFHILSAKRQVYCNSAEFDELS